jgi:hypothetical protein
LERLKAAAYAAQLRVIADFAVSQEAANKAMGIEARQAQRGIPEQIGWARKVSPASAARQLGQARALIDQMPDTYGLLLQGEISEHVATIVTTETSHLAVEDRRLVDKKLAEQLPRLSPKRAHAATRRLAIEADPAGAVRRASNAREDRRVGIRPAPDTMTILSALLPCEQGVAAYAALRRTTDAAIAAGDGRSRGQIMADTLVERLTGQASADAVSAEIGLVMTVAALFGGDDSAADLAGYGPIPAELARDIARAADDGAAQPVAAEPRAAAGAVARARIFLRRLFTDPATGVIETATRDAAGSTVCSLGYSSTGISTAATRSATRRSGTLTTSRPSPPADPPPARTAAVFVSEATTPDKCRGSPSASLTRPGMWSKSPHRTGISTDHRRQPRPVPTAPGANRARCQPRPVPTDGRHRGGPTRGGHRQGSGGRLLWGCTRPGLHRHAPVGGR